MENYFEFACTTPYNEPCAQLGSDDYNSNARLEAKAFIRQLQRAINSNPIGTRFEIIHCPHDRGPYLDIRFDYDDEVQEHVAYLAKLEEGCDTWDETAIQELTAAGYTFPKVEDDEEDFEDEDFETTDNGPTGHGDDCLSDADLGL